MDPFFCRNLFASSTSTSGSESKKVINTEEITLENFQKMIDD